jgi:hypothetical protein
MNDYLNAAADDEVARRPRMQSPSTRS